MFFFAFLQMRQLATVTNVGNSSPSATVRRSSSETDNVSVSSFATGSEVDAGLQEAYFGLVSIVIAVVI